MLVLGLVAALVGMAFAVKALMSPQAAATLGKTAASLAGGGVFVASLGAPALKRQAMAREALAAFAARRGLSVEKPDEARGELDGVMTTVRITYGSGPYKSRGASGLLVHVRPADGANGYLVDSEPFDDATAVERHLDRLSDRAVRATRPPEA